jgi:hypothetical protein
MEIRKIDPMSERFTVFQNSQDLLFKILAKQKKKKLDRRKFVDLA